MTHSQLPVFRDLLSRPWAFKLLCIIAAAPLMITAFAPVLLLAAGMHK